MRSFKFILLAFFLPLVAFSQEAAQELYLRVNQMGYLQDDHKVAIAFSHGRSRENVQLVEENTNKVVWARKPHRIDCDAWANFESYYGMNFSDMRQEGRYFLQAEKSKGK